MAWVQFSPLRHLSPSAFKLYVYFLDSVQAKNCPTLTIPLADLGYDSGLQAPHPYRALRHGKDGQLRRALDELIEGGWIEKQGRRGKAPNTYRVLPLSPELDLPPYTKETRMPS